MPDDVANFAYSAVATAPSPATSGTSLVVTAGQGALFPAVPFNAVICPTATQPLASNAEIVRVTAISTDTLTIARAQEATTARTVVVGDQIYAGVTAKTLTDFGDTAPVILTAMADPAAPAAGYLALYSKSISGRVVPKIKGPSGLDTPLQNAFWQNNIVMWNPTTATAGVWLGTAGAGAGTFSTALPTTTTSLFASVKRARWANIVTTANQVLGQRNTEAMFLRGTTYGGGFFMYARVGMDVWTNGGRFFCGFHSGTTVISADPSALNNTMGFAVDVADNGAISFLTRASTTGTKASTGYTITSGVGYDMYIWCKPGDTKLEWRIVDINAGTENSGTATATLPSATVGLTVGALASNAALTPVTSTQIGLNRIYVETDY